MKNKPTGNGTVALSDGKTVEIGGICVRVVRKNVRNVYVRISDSGEVTISVPRYLPDADALRFAESKLPWIRRRRELVLARPGIFADAGASGGSDEAGIDGTEIPADGNPFRRGIPTDGAGIPVLGESAVLAVLYGQPRGGVSLKNGVLTVRLRSGAEDGNVSVPFAGHAAAGKSVGRAAILAQRGNGNTEHKAGGHAVSEYGRAMNRFFADRLNALLLPLIPVYEEKMGVRVASVSLRDMATRWGSCTVRTANIRLSTRLALYPPECAEAVLVHEMCHLLEPSHNERFHALTVKFFPGTPEAEKLLKG